MNKLKRALGPLWFLTGLAAIALLLYAAFHYIGTTSGDAGKPLPWLIIIFVFTPVAIGLIVFGVYCMRGYYNTDAAEQP